MSNDKRKGNRSRKKKGGKPPFKNKKRRRKPKKLSELANELGLSTTTLISLLAELGYKVRSAVSPVNKEMEEAIRKRIESEKREHQESLERKKRIWGEGKERSERRSSRRPPRIDDSTVEKRIKETLARKPGKRRRKRIAEAEEEVEEERVIRVPGPLPLRKFAELLGEKPTDVVNFLFKQGILATLNQTLDEDIMSIVAEHYGYELEIGAEEEVSESEEEEITSSELKPRPPVVTVMGHVDHGKTTLLDYLRKSNIAKREAGGITQHVGAYRVEYEGQIITFIDTPGHEAFTALRARGAQVTDIVVLVVAADDGVMPQTVEAINHAKVAGVPIIVAINKIDKPNADPEKVMTQLTQYGLVPEEWGGNTIVVQISALKGTNIDALLTAILIKAEELDLKAAYDVPARAVVLESKLETGRGPVGTVIVKQGTLKVGDPFVAGTTYGKVRALYDEFNEKIDKVTPGLPALVQGFEELPQAGSILRVTKSESEAREIAERNKEQLKNQGGRISVTDRLAQMMEEIKAGEKKQLGIILKGDTQGSIEAIHDSLSRMKYQQVELKILHMGVGPVSESDVLLADTADAVIIAFNVKVTSKAREAARTRGILIKTYKVIYQLFEDVKKLLTGLLEPEKEEVVIGQAEVRQTFRISKGGTAAGCYVLNGVIERNAFVRVRRDGEVIFDGRIESLKRFKDDVKEVQAGYECGIKIEGFDKIKPGDIIEAYKVIEKEPELIPSEEK